MKKFFSDLTRCQKLKNFFNKSLSVATLVIVLFVSSSLLFSDFAFADYNDYAGCMRELPAQMAARNHMAVSDFNEADRHLIQDTCREQFPASTEQTGTNPAPANNSAPAGSAGQSANNSAPAGGSVAQTGTNPAPANNSAPAGGAQSGGGTPTGGSATVYTGPGFVNVTPFSVFGKVSIDRIINNVINYISGFLATIAVLSLMYGGVLYMTAGGDNGKIGKAKQVLTLTGVGLVIGSLAYMIIIFTTRLFYGS